MPANEPNQDKTGTAPAANAVDGPKGEELKAALAEANLPAEGTANEQRAALVEAGHDPNLKAAQEQKALDDRARLDDHTQPVIREANPNFGGEIFWS